MPTDSLFSVADKITLDLDAWDDETHGQQQLSLLALRHSCWNAFISRRALACYLYTTFANSRGPRHEICAREIGSFELPVFQEREDVRGNRGRVARD